MVIVKKKMLGVTGMSICRSVDKLSFVKPQNGILISNKIGFNTCAIRLVNCKLIILNEKKIKLFSFINMNV